MSVALIITHLYEYTFSSGMLLSLYRCLAMHFTNSTTYFHFQERLIILLVTLKSI